MKEISPNTPSNTFENTLQSIQNKVEAQLKTAKPLTKEEAAEIIKQNTPKEYMHSISSIIFDEDESTTRVSAMILILDEPGGTNHTITINSQWFKEM